MSMYLLHLLTHHWLPTLIFIVATLVPLAHIIQRQKLVLFLLLLLDVFSTTSRYGDCWFWLIVPPFYTIAHFNIAGISFNRSNFGLPFNLAGLLKSIYLVLNFSVFHQLLLINSTRVLKIHFLYSPRNWYVLLNWGVAIGLIKGDELPLTYQWLAQLLVKLRFICDLFFLLLSVLWNKGVGLGTLVRLLFRKNYCSTIISLRLWEWFHFYLFNLFDFLLFKYNQSGEKTYFIILSG